MIIFPPYLETGDTIGIVSPSGYMQIERMQTCIETLDAWGYTVELGATTHSQSKNYFAGTDDERLADLQHMLDQKHIKAILFARGGYGMSRIVDRINFKKFRKHPKWLIGFSDITILHAHILSKYKIATLHAPMAGAFADAGAGDPYIASLRLALEGKKASYTTTIHPYNREGEASGQLVGGNLTLLAHITGTASDIKTRHKILFLEDVGEYVYNIDRMLLQLKRSGKLEGLAGLIIGGFTDNKDTERPFGKTVYEIIKEHVADEDYPVCFGFPVSHTKENYALKIGGHYTLSVTEDAVKLMETEVE